MLYVKETSKDLKLATDLEEALKRHKYGVLQIHDLKKTLNGKRIDFRTVSSFSKCAARKGRSKSCVWICESTCRISVSPFFPDWEKMNEKQKPLNWTR